MNEESVKLIPGPQFSFKQDYFAKTTQGTSGLNGDYSSGEVGDEERRRTVLVVFIGGVTFAEISALRFMSSQGGLNCNFVIMTTKLINGNSLVKSIKKQ